MKEERTYKKYILSNKEVSEKLGLNGKILDVKMEPESLGFTTIGFLVIHKENKKVKQNETITRC